MLFGCIASEGLSKAFADPVEVAGIDGVIRVDLTVDGETTDGMNGRCVDKTAAFAVDRRLNQVVGPVDVIGEQTVPFRFGTGISRQVKNRVDPLNGIFQLIEIFQIGFDDLSASVDGGGV